MLFDGLYSIDTSRKRSISHDDDRIILFPRFSNNTCNGFKLQSTLLLFSTHVSTHRKSIMFVCFNLLIRKPNYTCNENTFPS